MPSMGGSQGAEPRLELQLPQGLGAAVPWGAVAAVQVSAGPGNTLQCCSAAGVPGPLQGQLTLGVADGSGC